MSQQEIDRIFHENSHEDDAYTNGVMLPHGFARAAAEIRRQALEDVLGICDTAWSVDEVVREINKLISN